MALLSQGPEPDKKCKSGACNIRRFRSDTEASDRGKEGRDRAECRYLSTKRTTPERGSIKRKEDKTMLYMKHGAVDYVRIHANEVYLNRE